jgi:hypothetical protein
VFGGLLTAREIGLHDVLFDGVGNTDGFQFQVFVVKLPTEDFDLGFHDCDLVHPFTALLFVLPYGS